MESSITLLEAQSKINELQDVIINTQESVRDICQELLIRKDQVIQLQKNILSSEMNDDQTMSEYKKVMESYEQLKVASEQMMKNHKNLIDQYNDVLRLYQDSAAKEQALMEARQGKILEDRIICKSGATVQLTSFPRNTTQILSICSICHEDVDKSQPDSSFIDCMHWYHFSCIATWVMSHNVCPMCKKGVTVMFNTE